MVGIVRLRFAAAPLSGFADILSERLGSLLGALPDPLPCCAMLLALVVWLLSGTSTDAACDVDHTCPSNVALLSQASVQDLRRLILSCGLRVSDCIEKSDLVDRAREAVTRKTQGLCLPQESGARSAIPASSQKGPQDLAPKQAKPARHKPRKVAESRGLHLTVLPYTDVQVSKASSQALRKLLQHFGGSSRGIVNKSDLLQRALQALAQPKAMPKPHQIRYQGHLAHILTPKILKKTVQTTPLLFVFHGAGRTKEGVEASVLHFSKVAARRKLLVVLPMSLDRTWDLSLYSTTGKASADAAFIGYILDCLMRDYYIDTRRIAAMGFSDGGSFALSLAANNPGIFQAVMSWSAGYYLEAGSVPQVRSSRARTNVFHGHGDADELFDFHKVALPMRRSLRSSGHNVTSHSVRSAGHGVPPGFESSAISWWLDLPVKTLPLPA